MKDTEKMEGSEFISRYIEPTNDWAFKRLFGSTSDGELLKSLLNAIFPEKNISEIEYLNNEYPGMSEDSRKAIVDVQCRTASGEEFIVEIQNGHQKWFRNRALFYSTFPIQRQAQKGRYIFDFQCVYFVGILNFALDDEKVGPDCIERFKVLEASAHYPMTEAVQWVFVHLKKFNLGENDIRTMSDKWLYALKNMRAMMEKPKLLEGKVFKDLFDQAEFHNLAAKDQETYLKNMMNEYDIRNCIMFGIEDGYNKGFDKGFDKGLKDGQEAGLQQGLQEGLQKGIAEGRQEGIAMVAKNLLNQGLSLQAISEATGLSLEQISSIR